MNISILDFKRSSWKFEGMALITMTSHFKSITFMSWVWQSALGEKISLHVALGMDITLIIDKKFQILIQLF